MNVEHTQSMVGMMSLFNCAESELRSKLEKTISNVLHISLSDLQFKTYFQCFLTKHLMQSGMTVKLNETVTLHEPNFNQQEPSGKIGGAIGRWKLLLHFWVFLLRKVSSVQNAHPCE